MILRIGARAAAGAVAALCAVAAANAVECAGGACRGAGEDVDLLIRAAAAEASSMCANGACAHESSQGRILQLLQRAEAAMDAGQRWNEPGEAGSALYEASSEEEAAAERTASAAVCSGLRAQVEHLKAQVAEMDAWTRISHDIEAEELRQRKEDIQEGDAAENGPKEVIVQCGGGADVRIVDLPDAARAQNQCLVFSLTAPDVSSRLTVYCDGRYERVQGEEEGGDGSEEEDNHS